MQETNRQEPLERVRRVLPISPAQLQAITGGTMVEVAQTAVDPATGGQSSAG